MSETNWQGRRVLVTGARGFIGSHLCRRLTGAGALVHGVSSCPPSDPGGAVQWVQADLTKAEAIHQVLTRVRPELVFHLAGHVSGTQQISNVEPTFLMNLASTVHLLTAAVETHRCRIVLAGSMQEPHTADPTAVPCSPYAASKWACSGYARMFCALYQLPVVIARLFMVYGPLQWDVSKLLPYVILSPLKGEVPKVSSGTRELDWVYVNDVIEFLLLVSNSEYMDGRTLDVGTGELTSIRSITERVARLLGSDLRPESRCGGRSPARETSRREYRRDSPTHWWVAHHLLGRGLARTIRWYRTQVASGSLLRLQNGVHGD